MRAVRRNPWLFVAAAIFWGTFSFSSNKNVNRWQQRQNAGQAGGGFLSTNIVFSDCKVLARRGGFALFADPDMTGLADLTGDDNKNMCVDQINSWREAVSKDLPKYTASSAIESNDLTEFLKTTAKCSDFVNGNFQHIGSTVAGNFVRQDNSIFVVSAAFSSAVSCEGAVRQWASAFSQFNNAKPPAYTDNSGVYEHNDATAFVSMLSDSAQIVTCGTATGCEASNLLICYLKPSGITTGILPVSLTTWRSVEEFYSLKPKFTKHTGTNCLNSINKVRQVKELGLPPFTGTTSLYKSTRKARTINPALDDITCEAIENLTIDQMSANGHTIIYGVKAGSDSAPTPDEAVAHWESGFAALKDTLPPVFSSDSTLYKDYAVTGYVSMMTDTSRVMQCFDAIGCAKSAIICTLTTATLQVNKKPISDTTWGKIELLKGIRPKLSSLSGNCLTEINAVRTKEEIGLTAFTAIESTYTGNTSSETEESLFETMTCKDVDNSNVTVMSKSDSLMHHIGGSSTALTCAEAVEAWQKGISKFGDTIPPAYSPDVEPYNDSSATNFVSLVSEKATAVACYEATGCSSKALVCRLTPAALETGVPPISEQTWQKLVGVLAPNGSAAAFPTLLALIAGGGLTALVAFGAAGLQL